MRFAELAVFLMPLALYVVWHRTASRGAAPSRPTMVAIAAGLLAFGAGLAWFGVHERLPAGAQYVPARLDHGQVVPGHAG